MIVTALVQARMGSTRLPGKVLMDIAGTPMLSRVVERVSRAAHIDRTVVATSDLPADDRIARFCEENGIACGRGSEQDVLDRFFTIAQDQYPSDVIVRITSDCPLIGPALVDRVTEKVTGSAGKTDYACNFLPGRTYPRGLDAEAITFSALKKAWTECNNPEWREHVTPYIYRNPYLFRIDGVVNDRDLSGMLWTVSTPEGLEFVRRVYSHFSDPEFSWRDVLRVI